MEAVAAGITLASWLVISELFSESSRARADELAIGLMSRNARVSRLKQLAFPMVELVFEIRVR